MTAHHEIYLNSGLGVDDSAVRIADVLGVPLLPRAHEEYRAIVARDGTFSYFVRLNGRTEDDPAFGLYFSRYRIKVVIRHNNTSRRDQEREAADVLFDALHGLGWGLMLVYDGQTLLREGKRGDLSGGGCA